MQGSEKGVLVKCIYKCQVNDLAPEACASFMRRGEAGKKRNKTYSERDMRVPRTRGRSHVYFEFNGSARGFCAAR